MDHVGLKNKNILVTGGSGYLGNLLCQKLVLHGANVFNIDQNISPSNSEVVNFKVDLKSKDALKKLIHKINPDYIYHLAASINRSRDFEITEDVLSVNLNGTINLLNALKDINYKNFIFTSTSEVYSGKDCKPPFTEDMLVTGASPYSLSKICAENSIKTFSNIYKKNYTILRLFNFYGSNMPGNFFLTDLINKLKTNEDFDMTHGEQKRDFLHVEDIIQALILSLKIPAYNNIFNVSSGKAKSIKEIAIELKEKLRSKSKINFGALPYRKNELWEMVGDNSKFVNTLGYKINKPFYQYLIND